MQLHPDQSNRATKHAADSLAAGFIGLGFRNNPGDLTTVEKGDLDGAEQNYWRFAHEMEEEDVVLVMVHHFPFALVRVSGPYNYIRTPVPHLGVWFRHFRAVDEVQYYADHVTNANTWDRITMTDTISPLRNEETQSYQLIEDMLSARDA